MQCHRHPRELSEGPCKVLCDTDMLAGESVIPDGCYTVVPNAVRNKVLSESGGYCSECKKYVGFGTDLHVHHILPRNDGGNNDESNLKVLCRDCHHCTHIGIRYQQKKPSYDHLLAFIEERNRQYFEAVIFDCIPLDLKVRAQALKINLSQVSVAAIEEAVKNAESGKV